MDDYLSIIEAYEKASILNAFANEPWKKCIFFTLLAISFLIFPTLFLKNGIMGLCFVSSLWCIIAIWFKISIKKELSNNVEDKKLVEYLRDDVVALRFLLFQKKIEGIKKRILNPTEMDRITDIIDGEIEYFKSLLFWRNPLWTIITTLSIGIILAGVGAVVHAYANQPHFLPQFLVYAIGTIILIVVIFLDISAIRVFYKTRTGKLYEIKRFLTFLRYTRNEQIRDQIG